MMSGSLMRSSDEEEEAGNKPAKVKEEVLSSRKQRPNKPVLLLQLQRWLLKR